MCSFPVFRCWQRRRGSVPAEVVAAAVVLGGGSGLLAEEEQRKKTMNNNGLGSVVLNSNTIRDFMSRIGSGILSPGTSTKH